MLTIRTDDAVGLIEVEVNGRIERSDFDRAMAEIDRLLEAHRQVLAVEIIRSFGGMDPALWWRDFTWGIGHVHKFARAAVVTDTGWIGPIARAVGALLPTEVRHFPLSELDAARRWAVERR